MARTLARAQDGQVRDRRPVRPSTSSIQPSGAGSSSDSDATPHSEQTAIDDARYRRGGPEGDRHADLFELGKEGEFAWRTDLVLKTNLL
jgi:hypothetical protein